MIKTSTSNVELILEINNLPSKTIPDQTLSIPELIKRYASGLPLGGAKVPIYDEDPENDYLNGTNWKTLDLSEQHNIIQNHVKEYNETVQRLRNHKSSNSEDFQTEQSNKPQEINSGGL